MAVISITLSDSPLETVKGIPKTVSISVNIASTIFYTLDGSDPSVITDALIYVDAITLPTDKANAVLKIYATNGSDSSAVITQTYKNTTFAQNRNARDTVIGLQHQPLPGPDLFPFGSNSPQPNAIYGNTGGITVNEFDDQTNLPDGYDGTATGTVSNYTDKELTDYKFKYSTTNRKGEVLPNVGTLPAQIRIFVPPAPPQTSNTNDKRLFNPKSLVIIQDGRDTDPDNVPQLNRPFFSSENINRAKDGSMYYTTAGEASPTGSFVRQHYNPKDQTITYYYFDSAALRWIISIEPYTPRQSQLWNLNEIVFSPSNKGNSHVYKWLPFYSRILG